MTRARLLRASLILAAVCTSGAERLGDFNGDGKADVLLRHDDGSWRMHLMDGASVGQGLPVRLTSKLEWYWMGAGDFNGDGNDDVMLRRDDGVWFYHPLDGSRVIVEERGWANLTRKLDFRTVGVGDFNGDGRDDILMRRTDGAWVYYPMNGRRVSRAEAGWANLPRDVDWRMAGVGDFDGDGRDDVLLRHVGGLWRAYAMNGRRVRHGAPTETTLPRDVLWHATGVGDLDGDGRDDVLLRHADGRWEYRLVDGPVGTPMDLGNDWAWRVAGIGEHADRDTVLLRRDDGQWRWHDTQARMTPTREVDLPQATHWQVSGRPVYIPDKGLRTAVASALGKGHADWMRPRELAALHALKASHAEITDLAAIGAATGLVELNLGYNKITTVAPLAGLIRLNTLYLHHNGGIDDVSALAHLPTLRRLDLGGNKVADPSPLAALTQLWHLGLGYNAVHDASPLASLTALRYLDLNGNRIVDIRPLAKLTGLTRLHLKYNRIEDISPLAGLMRLEVLGLERNRVADIAVLENLTRLDTLNLAFNRITDLSPLVDNAGLSDGDLVDVRGNPLSGESLQTAVPILISRGVRVEAGTPARFDLVHDDSVVVLHVEADLATQNLFTGLPLDLYSNVLYSHFEDVFDFVMFFSNLDGIDEHEDASYYGVYSAVRNGVAGVGRSMFYSNAYGSAETLKGVIHFPYNRALRSGPSLHEMLHAWANFTVPTAVGGHWGFSSANGQLGGFDIGNLVELGDDRYAAGRFGTFANGGNRPAYSPVELYFAGYIPPEEVPDLWVAADGQWVVEDGGPARTEDGHGIFMASDVRTYSIEDIVAKAGPRVPSMADAQWHFRVAIVLLTDDDHPATDQQLALLSDHAAWFSLAASDESYLHNFYEATGGRGTVTMDGLSRLQGFVPAAVPGLPPSFGVVPEPHVTLLDGRCLPLSSARMVSGTQRQRDAGAHGRLFTGER